MENCIGPRPGDWVDCRERLSDQGKLAAYGGRSAHMRVQREGRNRQTTRLACEEPGQSRSHLGRVRTRRHLRPYSGRDALAEAERALAASPKDYANMSK